MTRRLVLLLALAASMWWPATAAAEPIPCASLPINLIVPPAYERSIANLIAQSPTLRRQCAIIASVPQVHVLLQAGYPARECRASTSFFRQGPVLRAHVSIPVSMDFPELLAHEFEHVIEQIEGLDLRRLSRQREAGVREVRPNAFETDRAVAAGRRAAAEVLLPCADPLSPRCTGTPLVASAAD